MKPDPRQIAASQVERLVAFPPDITAWNALMWSAWSSWLAMVECSCRAWPELWLGASAIGARHRWPPLHADVPKMGLEATEPVPETAPLPESFA